MNRTTKGIGINEPVCLIHRDLWDHEKGQPLSKGESAHTPKPKHPELITADMLGAGHLECAEAIEYLTAERDKFREQVKELLAICKALAERGAVIATTGLGDKLNATIKHVESRFSGS